MSDISLTIDDPEKGEYPGWWNLHQHIRKCWDAASDGRETHERRWMESFRNYRGEYDQETLSRIEGDNSKVFVKITKTKVLASFGQINDIMFAGNKFPLTIDPTPKPLGVAENAYLDESGAGEQPDPYGYPGDGRSLEPGSTATSILGGLKEKFKGLIFKEGKSPDPARIPQISPAEETAKAMQKIIYDQLEESKASVELKKTIFEMCLLGHGMLKGPVSYRKTYHNWTNGEYDPKVRIVPDLKHVSCWDIYPDPNCKSLDDADFIIERHVMTASQVRDLYKRPLFIKERILDVLEDGPNHIPEWWETQIKDSQIQDQLANRFDVLEYWGTADKQDLEDAGIKDLLSAKALAEFDDLDEFHINAWICGNHLIRLTINPYNPVRIPYFSCPYETHPYQFWGVGIPENMKDSQTIINGHSRMAIDNLKLAGNVMLELDEQSMVPGQKFEIKAGKIWRRQFGGPGQMINSIKIDPTTEQNMMMVDRFRQFADEQTGISSISHGVPGYQTGVRTASQTSMLLSAAALTIKTVINNIDDFLIKPIGDSFFAWNMQFNVEEMPEIKGDLEIKATGTSSLMQKEVKSQRVLQFIQVAGANPLLAPFVKWHVILQDFAEQLDIDPDKAINNPEEAALLARTLGLAQGGQPMNDQMNTATPGQSQEQAPDLSGNGAGTAAPPAPANPEASAKI